ncbi:ABC transporter permease [Falsirhodobacter halotolerans]|uniref:ABC transporter permease n=1 Tax=Falsirhodobacter halotolerans TaxID=1146892 RepID=UPI001FD4F5E0|nr:ABC transporter permease [Falsirhodobacter halotolerans]MCJ8141233.1 ABC transporter permease [Falsirhodobacter halotolerans]
MGVVKFLWGAACVLFLMGPLIVVMPIAFTAGGFMIYPIEEWSLRWFRVLFGDPAWRLSIWNSLVVGLASSALATILGTLAGLGLRGRAGLPVALARTAFLLPMAVPAVVLGVGMQLVYARMGLSSTYTGLIVGHAVLSVPFVILSVTAALAGVDRSVERAAASLGAAPPHVLWLVTLPMALPGIVTGFVFAFANSLDEVVLTIFLAGPNQRTLARQMFLQLRDNLTPAIAAAAVTFIIATICIGIAGLWLQNRRKRMGVA